MPSAPACPPAEVSGALPPGDQRTPSPDPELAADPDYQEGLQKIEAARFRRAEISRTSQARKQNQGSGPANPVLAPKSTGVTKPAKKRGPNKYWACSRYDPLPLFLIYFFVSFILFICLFFTILALLY